MPRLRKIGSKPARHDGQSAKRIFFAIDLPERTMQAVKTLMEEISVIPPNLVTWVKAENLHVTLKFLGDVKADLIKDICAVARKTFSSSSPITLTIEGMGIFPNHDRPRVVWLGVKGETTGLARIESAISRNFEPLGYPPDQRPFTAHLTIGRVKNESVRGRLIRLVRQRHSVALGDVPVNAITLYESRLDPKGAVYTLLESFPLQG